MVKKLNYFTLVEFYQTTGFTYTPHASLGSADWFTSHLSSVYLKFNIYGLDSTKYTATIVNACVNELMSIVSNRHMNDYVVYTEEDTLTATICAPFLQKILTQIEITAPKYIPMLKENENETKDLMRGAKSSSATESRFNDTPQSEGYYNNDSHATTTTYAKNNGELETGSVVDRLKALYDNFESVILMWSNEFNRLFIMEEQISE